MTTAKSARAKGLYTYPNKIGKKFGLWFYGDESSIVRSRSSGLYGKNNKDHSGDLEVSLSFAKKCKSIHGKFPDFFFNIELKHDKRWNLKELLGSPFGGFLFNSFKQSFDDSLDPQATRDVLFRYPLLVFTKNYEADYVLFPVQINNIGINPFREVGSFSYISTCWEYEFINNISSVIVVTVLLEDFLQLSPKDSAFKLNLANWKRIT